MADHFLMTPDGKDASSTGCAYFGEGVKFKGSISVPEKIVVHGTVEGDVESRELFVGPTGIIKGNVRVDQADVQGKVLENIEARVCLSLRRTGLIEGKAAYGEIEIEKGGILSGELASISNPDGGQLMPLPMKWVGDRSYDGPQLSSIDLPQITAAGKSDAKSRSDGAKLDVKLRPDSSKSDAKAQDASPKT